ncbi:YhgE/Pip domain-containing protein [Herbiconiux sp. VKM Ac-1786]|uniref:YhgE/Pip domain-containing protein n=1 Tax=Herbiconiux sp. VKM Ac-1786 TaxID=2783824 RepID=UPI00188C7EC1|nr:YhgE/Pip domain-containing protein [Herbiconiux sp. VKM Ac-1786]MBF4572722.1 YhgE/Pip domain-containing protein [Herbiconiux sp. VKM Ac-1786]
MSTSTSTPTPRSKRRTRLALIVLAAVAVALTPLAVNGLFAGALSNADTNLTQVPAAIVNNDKLVTTTAADGTQSVNFAGRGLVTELTGPGESGFGWELTNSEQAEEGLKDGTYYAVLTIPEDFSATLNTLATPDPKSGLIDIQTDDAHGYLSGILASTVASAVQAGFGQTVTAQVVNGVYTSFGTLGTSLSDAASGASQLGTGADGLATGATQLADGLNTISTGAAAAVPGASQLADGLTELSAGASSTSTGAAALAAGLPQLSSGVTASAAGAAQVAGGVGGLASGAAEFSTGVDTYTGAVDQFAGGVGQLGPASDGIRQLIAGIPAYTDGVSQSAVGAQALSDAIAADPTAPDELKAAAAQLASGLGTLSENGTLLAGGAAQLAPVPDALDALVDAGPQLTAGSQPLRDGAKQLSDGLGQVAPGAAQVSGGLATIAPNLATVSDGVVELSGGLGSLASGLAQTAPGAGALATGVEQLSDGVAQTVPGAEQLASGATQLGDGAEELSSGLSTGADQLNAQAPSDSEAAAKVAATPVDVDVSTANQVNSIGQVVSTILLPTALWIGALALFLWLRPFSRQVLASSVPTGRLTRRTFSIAGGLAAAQTLIVVLFIHIALGVEWASFPATLGFSLLVALAFTAFHQLLSTAFGRIGSVISLVLLALQLASTGGLYPVEILSAPFQAISAVTPLSYAVAGIQAILTGGSAGTVLSAAVVMVVMLLLSLALSQAALARRRRPDTIGWTVPQRARPATA